MKEDLAPPPSQVRLERARRSQFLRSLPNFNKELKKVAAQLPEEFGTERKISILLAFYDRWLDFLGVLKEAKANVEKGKEELDEEGAEEGSAVNIFLTQLKTIVKQYYSRYPQIFRRSGINIEKIEIEADSFQKTFIRWLTTYAIMYDILMNARIVKSLFRGGDAATRELSKRLRKECENRHDKLIGPSLPSSKIENKRTTREINALDLVYQEVDQQDFSLSDYFFYCLNTQLEAIFLSLGILSTGLVKHQASTTLGKAGGAIVMGASILEAFLRDIPGMGIITGLASKAGEIIKEIDYKRILENIKNIVGVLSSDQFKILADELAQKFAQIYIHQLGGLSWHSTRGKKVKEKVEQKIGIARENHPVKKFAEYINSKILLAIIAGEITIPSHTKIPDKQISYLFDQISHLMVSTPPPEGRFSTCLSFLESVMGEEQVFLKGKNVGSFSNILCKGSVLTRDGVYYEYIKEKNKEPSMYGFIQLSVNEAEERASASRSSIEIYVPKKPYPSFMAFTPTRSQIYKTYPAVVKELEEAKKRIALLEAKNEELEKNMQGLKEKLSRSDRPRRHSWGM